MSNKDEIDDKSRYEIQSIIQEFHDPLNDGSGHHNVIYAAKAILTLKKKWEHQAFLEGQKFGIKTTMEYHRIPKKIINVTTNGDK
jgi:hypothetical protein